MILSTPSRPEKRVQRSKSAQEASVLVLGRFARRTADGAKVPALELLRQEGRQVTGMRPIMVMDMPSFSETYPELSPSALASAVMVQEAVEGGGPRNIRAIFINTAGVEFARGGSLANPRSEGHRLGSGAHTSAEYRNLVVTMAAAAHKVDIYIAHGGGTSVIRAGRMTTEGAQLPDLLRDFLPPSFFPNGFRPPGGGGSQGGAEGRQASTLKPSTTAGGLRSTPTSTVSALKGPARQAPGAAAARTGAGGRAAAIAVLITQAAEIFGVMNRDPVFARFFAKRQNDYFKRLGIAGTTHMTAAGNFTVYVPTHDQLRRVLERDVETWSDYSKFLIEAGDYGFDFQFQEWVFVLPKDEHGVDVVYSVDEVIQEMFQRLDRTDGPPPPWVITGDVEADALKIRAAVEGLATILPGEWRGTFEEDDASFPVRVELDTTAFSGIEGTYSFEDASGRHEGELSDMTVSGKTMTFVWQEGSLSGVVTWRFVDGRLVGGWSYKGAKFNAGKWTLVKK